MQEADMLNDDELQLYTAKMNLAYVEERLKVCKSFRDINYLKMLKESLEDEINLCYAKIYLKESNNKTR